MKVTEETDALKSMGLNPIAYVLTPKIYAIVLMMPLLTILSVVIGFSAPW
jgi:phospholipid/cholesterol/gamma-HCH transport system permease protein